ncbi:MAG: DUF3015 domain-containing protein [Burkholderiales bacterium]|nr:DUF3015 domain-containing protein [Burkholderiales bacterium]
MIMRKTVVAVSLTIVSGLALAAGENNVGSCGWGSKLFDGQSGIFPQALAGITNGTFGNQTFAVSTGSSGCTQDGTVKSGWQTAAFIDGNKEKLARDMSRGSGESLDSLAAVLGVEEKDRARFVQVTRDNLAIIFPSSTATTDEIRTGLRAVLNTDRDLAAYSARV